MAYSSGGLIEATDYNGFVASVNAVWGTGSGSSGYGQTSTLASVSAGSSTVTATQWSTLIARINTMRQQQTGSTAGLTGPTAGSTITYLSTLSGAISTVTTNRLTAIANGASVKTTITNATGWVTSSTKEVSITFASANQMRYWFNAGGFVSFTVSGSVLSGNTKSTDWQSLLVACGTVSLGAIASQKTGGSGTPSTYNTGLGFYNLTTAYQTILDQFSTTSTGGYNLNHATFQAKVDATPGSSVVLYLRVVLTDGASDTVNDTVTGTVQLDYTYVPPSTTYLSNVWGAVTVATVTNTQA